LWVVPGWRSLEALRGKAAVVTGAADLDTLVHLGTGFEPEDGGRELERAAARAALHEQPVSVPPFGKDAPLWVELSHRGLRCTAALDAVLAPEARLTLM